ncbi:MAG: phosphoribosyl-AMP cyclohydrolasephosphoribosyl-ATP pyrophosphatase [Candidatus Saccharibacteria bacterium]|nr:phosphoribosyl-AMP cyclohydrolasephosphoribosyl-ATP pyrophosphatase [Candidatus Saccharibacteria bacterium]
MSELRLLTNIDKQLCFDKAPFTEAGQGMVSAIAIDRLMLAIDGLAAVRMQAYMTREAVEATILDGFVTWFSRSRQDLWQKGETTGNVLRVRDACKGGLFLGRAIWVDCDGDSLLIDVEPMGPTCHTGARSCFEM